MTLVWEREDGVGTNNAIPTCGDAGPHDGPGRWRTPLVAAGYRSGTSVLVALILRFCICLTRLKILAEAYEKAENIRTFDDTPIRNFFLDLLEGGIKESITPVPRVTRVLEILLEKREGNEIIQKYPKTMVLLADCVWSVGAGAATGAGGITLPRFKEIVTLMDSYRLLTKRQFITFLDDSMLTDNVVKVDQVKKCQRRINTRGRYTLTLYNRFSESPEGFSQMAAHFDFILGSKVGIKDGKVKGVVEAIGKTIAAYDISQVRAGSLFIDAVEYWLAQENAIAAPGEAFVEVGKTFFGKELLTKVMGFQFGAHKRYCDKIADPPPPAPTNEKDGSGPKKETDKLKEREAKFANPEKAKAQSAMAQQSVKSIQERADYEQLKTRFDFGMEKDLYRAAAWLVKAELLDAETLWLYLSPNETELKECWNKVEAAYEKMCNNMNPDALVDNSKQAKADMSKFQQDLEDFNTKGGQKFNFLAANICMNNWSFAQAKLKNLECYCRPAEHVGIRKALAALCRHALSHYEPIVRKAEEEEEENRQSSSSRKESTSRRSKEREEDRKDSHRGDDSRRPDGKRIHSTRSSDIAAPTTKKEERPKSNWEVMLDPVGLHNQGLDSSKTTSSHTEPERRRYDYGRDDRDRYGRPGYPTDRDYHARKREEEKEREAIRKERDAKRKQEEAAERKRKKQEEKRAAEAAKNFMSDKIDIFSSTEKGKSLPVITTIEGFNELVKLIECLDSTLRDEPELHILIWQIIGLFNKDYPESVAPAKIVIYKYLLPAISQSYHVRLAGAAWNVLKQMRASVRFELYACWEACYDSYPMEVAQKLTIKNTRTLLKRVVNNAERADAFSHDSHKHFAKLCDANPLPALTVLMKNLEYHFNVNMIVPYTDLLDSVSDLTADVVCFLCARKSVDKDVIRQYGFLDASDATVKAWLNHLGEFVGRFFRRHYKAAIGELVTFWTKQINEHTMKAFLSEKCNPVGEVLLRVIIEKVLQFTGGQLDVKDLNEDQLFCLAGSPLLRGISIGAQDIRKEGATRRYKARRALRDALISANDAGVTNVQVLWYSLAMQRAAFDSSTQIIEWFNRQKGGGLKLLGFLFDGAHNAMLQLTEFLVQVCSPREYYDLMPPFKTLFDQNEPAMAFMILRAGLPKYGGATSQQIKLDDQETIDGVSVDFYLTFWRLSLYDIYIPTDHYEKQENFLNDQILEQTNIIQRCERQKMAGEREHRRATSEKRALEDQLIQLKNERLEQEKNYAAVCKRLAASKDGFVKDPSPSVTRAIVKHLIAPRVLLSEADALFCARFINLMIDVKMYGFQLLDFYNQWTLLLPQFLLCCSDSEARVFGIFLSEAMGHMLTMRKDPQIFEKESADNPVFLRNYYPRDYDVEAEGPKKQTQHADLVTGHNVWERRLSQILLQGLKSEDWQERRNALLVISNSYRRFPMTHRVGGELLRNITKISQEDKFQDLKTLGGSLKLRLSNNADNWFQRPKAKAKPKKAKTEAKIFDELDPQGAKERAEQDEDKAVSVEAEADTSGKGGANDDIEMIDIRGGSTPPDRLTSAATAEEDDEPPDMKFKDEEVKGGDESPPDMEFKDAESPKAETPIASPERTDKDMGTPIARATPTAKEAETPATNGKHEGREDKGGKRDRDREREQSSSARKKDDRQTRTCPERLLPLDDDTFYFDRKDARHESTAR
eukprot:gene349-741_t